MQHIAKRARLSLAQSSIRARPFSAWSAQRSPAHATAFAEPSLPLRSEQHPLPVRERVKERIAATDLRIGKPAPSPFLTDSFGRVHDYLRISLTERCNLRCTYCMPANGVPLLPREHLLTTDEVERIAKMFVQEGVTKIRLTGGEPTVRKDLLDVVGRLSALGLKSLGMTSNGISLKRKLPALVSAGLTHLNISLDTLDPFKYEIMTRRRGFEAVSESIDVAEGLKSSGLRTKVNVVVIRGVNDMEVLDFVNLTKDRDLTVRFIEYMPFEDNKWSTAKLVPSADLLAKVQTQYSSLTKLVDDKNDTTRAWRVPGHKGSFGFISSMSDHFCGTCSRLRVGADGGVKVCLFGPPVLSLRQLLRSDMSDEEILPHIGSAVYGKKAAHDGLGGPEGIRLHGKSGPMVAIGLGASFPNLTLHPAETLRTGVPAGRALRDKRSPRLLPLHLLASASPASPFASASASSISSRFSSTKATHQLTHIDPKTGKASMVSVSPKASTLRSATAVGTVFLGPIAYDLIVPSTSSEASTTMPTKKGDVLTIAQLAGIMGAKHTSLLIPLCHPLSLTHISVNLTPNPKEHSLVIRATAECEGKTGVEMEALTAVGVASLTVWDMCKSVAGKKMRIGDMKVVEKSGGKSGDWVRED